MTRLESPQEIYRAYLIMNGDEKISHAGELSGISNILALAQRQDLPGLKDAIISFNSTEVSNTVVRRYFHLARALYADKVNKKKLASSELIKTLSGLGETCFLPNLTQYGTALLAITEEDVSDEVRKIDQWYVFGGVPAVINSTKETPQFFKLAEKFGWGTPRPIKSPLPPLSIFQKHFSNGEQIWDKILNTEKLTPQDWKVLVTKAQQGNFVAMFAMAVTVIETHEIFWPVAHDYLRIIGQKSKDHTLAVCAALYAAEIGIRYRDDWIEPYRSLIKDQAAWVSAHAKRELAYAFFIRGDVERAIKSIQSAKKDGEAIGLDRDIWEEAQFYKEIRAI